MGTKAALNKFFPITCSPTPSCTGNTSSIWGLSLHSCVNSPAWGWGLRCEQPFRWVCVVQPQASPAPAIVLARSSSAQDWGSVVRTLLSSHLEHRSGWPTWPALHRAQQHQTTSCLNPRPQSTGLFWTCFVPPPSQIPRMAVFLLPYVLFFHPC